MQTNPFGKPLVLNIYLVENDQTYIPDETSSPDIYLYDNPPTRSQARTGDGSMPGYHLTEWIGDGDFRTVSFPPVPDRSPDSPVSEWTYYLAANFNLDASGDRQCIIKSVTLRRVASQTEALTIEQSDLEGVDSAVGRIFGANSVSLAGISQTVLNIIRARFRAKGIRWDRVKDPSELKDAAVFLALHLAYSSQIRTAGDTADRKQGLYYTHYKDLIDSAVLDLDVDGDSATDDVEQTDVDNTTWSFDR